MLALAEIAAVQVAFIRLYSVVAPFPHERAHETVGRVDYIPIIVYIPVAVAHGVRVLAKHERSGFLPVLQVFYHLVGVRVHARKHIYALGVKIRLIIHTAYALVMYRAGIAGMYVIRALVKHLAVVRLVAERPYHNAGAVFVALVHCYFPVAHSPVGYAAVSEILPTAQRVFVAVPLRHAVRFHVRLVHYVKSHAVAKVVKLGAVGIMACAYRVHIGVFHKLEVAYRFLESYRCARKRTELVAVHALQFNVLAVYFVYSVLYFARAKADAHEYLFAARGEHEVV